MNQFKFGVSEYCFPIWGGLAVQMAKEAGFDGIEITDGGGYLQPHPLNNGYVEYERLGLDLRRQDSFPLTDPYVQEDYLDAAARWGIQITGMKLHLLEAQGFIKAAGDTLQGKECLETIKNGIISASQMKIPAVTIAACGLFGVFQHEYAYEKLLFAAEMGREYGVNIFVSTDISAQKQIGAIDSLNREVRLDFHTITPELCGSGDPVEIIAAIGKERIGQFRMKDLCADAEGFLTKETSGNALLGEGNSKFAECAKAIKETSYCGWILSDTAYYSGDIHPVGSDYAELAARDVKTLREIFDKD